MRRLILSLLLAGVLSAVLVFIVTLANHSALATVNIRPDVIEDGKIDYEALESRGGYNVAYLLGDVIPPERSRLLSVLEPRFSARRFEIFDQLVTEYATTPWDAIVIEGSALSSIDATWLADIYWRGTIIVGVNIDHNRLNSLIGRSECGPQELHPALKDSYFILKTDLILADLEADAAKMKAESTCSKDTDNTPYQGYLVESSSGSSSQLDDAGYDRLVTSLQTKLDSVYQTRQAFAQRLHQKVLTRDAFIEVLTTQGMSMSEAEKLWGMNNAQ